MKKYCFLWFLFSFYFPINAFTQVYNLSSPDTYVQCQIIVGESIEYVVYYKGKNILEKSSFALKFDQALVFGKDVSILDVKEIEIYDRWQPVAGEFNEVVNHCNEINLRIKENTIPDREIEFVIRAYDDGIAFRYKIPESWKRFIPNYENRDWLLLIEERTSFSFPRSSKIWAADYGSYATHQESEFLPMNIADIQNSSIIGLPFLVYLDNQIYTAVTEADLTDWAGMYLKKDDSNIDSNFITLSSNLSPLPDQNGCVKIKPGAISPWRVVMISQTPGKLIESQIINNLNDPCAIDDPSWIKPGISAWDHWWSGEVKMDTKTIKEYIQLASDMGWEYMLIDWHWYGPPFITDGEWKANPDADITTVNPDVNMPDVLEFAKERDVKLILWLLWDHAERQMEEAFQLYEQWGIAGVKIDFMARDDQEMVNWYHKVVKKAAEHQLVVNFHGAYKPTGWSRTYPNLLTREGVLGNEYTKWSSRITPDHNVTLPFTRMLAGQMDYTPGGFLNVTPEQFQAGAPAMVMNTRCHQLAMFVIYFSPYTVACDHPDHYHNQPGLEFLKQVPTTWEDTRVLAGEVGEFIVMARKSNDRWYLGAMNNSKPRKIVVPIDFLPEGSFKLTYFRDASDADINPSNVDIGNQQIQGGDGLQLQMAAGGGFAGWIEVK